MKKYLFIFVLLLGAVSSWGQNVTDQEKVLQQCLGIQQVAAHYNLDVAGVPVSLYALKGTAQLQAGLQVDYNGRILAFVSQETLNTIKPDAYFAFDKVTVTGNQAEVDFTFSYDCNMKKQVIGLHVVLKKTDGLWTITGTK